jgi:hypothetical protein
MLEQRHRARKRSASCALAQHRIFVLRIAAFGLFEWRVRVRGDKARPAALVLPLTTALLLNHRVSFRTTSKTPMTRALRRRAAIGHSSSDGMAAFGPSLHIAPPRTVGRHRGIAEIDGPTSIAEGDARDPERSYVDLQEQLFYVLKVAK